MQAPAQDFDSKGPRAAYRGLPGVKKLDGYELESRDVVPGRLAKHGTFIRSHVNTWFQHKIDRQFRLIGANRG